MHKETLDVLPAGMIRYVIDIRDSVICEEIFKKGIFPGDCIRVIENNPGSKHIIIESNQREVKITKSKASQIVTWLFSCHYSLN